MSKKRSDMSTLPPSLHDHTFFTDRDLAKKFPNLLRAAGLNVVRYSDVFGRDEAVADNVWIQRAAKNGWVALTRDKNIKRDPEAIRTIRQENGRVFIVRGALPHDELATVFLEASDSVGRMLQKTTEPFVAVIRREVARGAVVHCKAVMWRKGSSLVPLRR